MDEEIRILCVDDEKSVLKALFRLFLDDDYEIITAESGEEGLEILKETGHVQLVISDYRMPGMNGVDFLKEVCKLYPDTVRIVLSGYADTAAIVEAINEGGIYKFIPKPWNDDELKVTISHALDYYLIQRNDDQVTRELKIMLAHSQTIFDELPVGVVGINQDGLIVQCNRKGLRLLDKKENEIIGMDRKNSFAKDANQFIEEVMENGECSGHIDCNENAIKVKGVHIKHADGRMDIILTLEEVTTDE